MSRKSINEVAVEASLGLYGQGIERNEIIKSFGYNPKQVQKIINRSLKYGLPERDKVLGAANKTAITNDGTLIEYSDVWDLIEKVVRYYEDGSRKALPTSEKYVTTSFEDSKGEEHSSKLYYNNVDNSNQRSNPAMINNNNLSWSVNGTTNRANDLAGLSDLYSSNRWDMNDTANRARDLEGLSSLYKTPVVHGDSIESVSYKRGTNNILPSITFYIKNMLNDKTIHLPVHPEEVSESFSTNYSQTDLNGRSAPYQTYGGNEARTISLSATLHQDLCDEKTGSLQTIVMYLKQLVYPRYNGSIVIPPYCYVKFGDMISCYAIMDSIDFSWGDTIIEDSNFYSKCEVNFSFQELRRSSLPTVDNVFSGGKDSSS